MVQKPWYVKRPGPNRRTSKKSVRCFATAAPLSARPEGKSEARWKPPPRNLLGTAPPHHCERPPTPRAPSYLAHSSGQCSLLTHAHSSTQAPFTNPHRPAGSDLSPGYPRQDPASTRLPAADLLPRGNPAAIPHGSASPRQPRWSEQ
jgi:hypothetical protein